MSAVAALEQTHDASEVGRGMAGVGCPPGAAWKARLSAPDKGEKEEAESAHA